MAPASLESSSLRWCAALTPSGKAAPAGGDAIAPRLELPPIAGHPITVEDIGHFF